MEYFQACFKCQFNFRIELKEKLLELALEVGVPDLSSVEANCHIEVVKRQKLRREKRLNFKFQNKPVKLAGRWLCCLSLD